MTSVLIAIFSLQAALATPAPKAAAAPEVKTKPEVSADTGTAGVVAGATEFIVKPDSRAEFKATGKPGFLKINGGVPLSEGKLVLSGGQLTGDVKVPLDSIDTGIELRNRHLKEKYLETAKYPTATLKLLPIKITGDEKTLSMTGIPFKGILQMHGKEKEIEGTADIRRSANQLVSVASFNIKLSDYGVAVPSYSGVTVAEDVGVKVNLATQ